MRIGGVGIRNIGTIIIFVVIITNRLHDGGLVTDLTNISGDSMNLVIDSSERRNVGNTKNILTEVVI
jgi:hypothetical protein